MRARRPRAQLKIPIVPQQLLDAYGGNRIGIEILAEKDGIEAVAVAADEAVAELPAEPLHRGR